MADEESKNVICGVEYSDEKYQEYVIQAKKFLEDPNMKGAVPYMSAEEPNVITDKIRLDNPISDEEKTIHGGIASMHQIQFYHEYPMLNIVPIHLDNIQPDLKDARLAFVAQQIEKIDNAYEKLPQEVKSSANLVTPMKSEVKDKSEMMHSMRHLSDKFVPSDFKEAMILTKELQKQSTTLVKGPKYPKEFDAEADENFAEWFKAKGLR